MFCLYLCPHLFLVFFSPFFVCLYLLSVAKSENIRFTGCKTTDKKRTKKTRYTVLQRIRHNSKWVVKEQQEEVDRDKERRICEGSVEFEKVCEQAGVWHTSFGSRVWGTLVLSNWHRHKTGLSPIMVQCKILSRLGQSLPRSCQEIDCFRQDGLWRGKCKRSVSSQQQSSWQGYSTAVALHRCVQSGLMLQWQMCVPLSSWQFVITINKQHHH